MRRRWRRRDAGAENRRSAIDAARICEELVEAGVGGATRLAPLALEGVPPERAMLAEGIAGEGAPLLLGFAPHDGMDALLAVLAAPGDGAARVAVAPRWSNPALRVIEAVRSGRSVRALVGVAGEEVDATPIGRGTRGVALPASRVVDGISDPIRRELFGRAVAALEGLAAKHGGGVRGFGERVELVVFARTAAVLRDAGGVALETHLGERSTAPLGPEDLPDAMDRLEGALRKRLGDRRARSGEEGLRAQLAARAATAAGGRGLRLWPLGGATLDVIDFVAIAEDGVPLLGALREELTLEGLADILSAAFAAAPALPGLLAQAAPPVRLSELRVVLAARSYAPAVQAALDALDLPLLLFDIDTQLSPPELRRRVPTAPVEPQRRSVPPPSRPAPTPAREQAPVPELPAPEVAAPRARESDPWRRAAAEIRSVRDEPPAHRVREEPAVQNVRDEPTGEWRTDEVSAFDLEDDPRPPEGGGTSGGGGAGGRRRRRGRRRGRRGGAGAAGEEIQDRGDGSREGDSARAGAAAAPRAHGDAGGADDEDDEPAKFAAAEPVETGGDSEGADDDLVAEDLLDESGTLPMLDERAPDPDEESFLAREPEAGDDDEEEDEPSERGPERRPPGRWRTGRAAAEVEPSAAPRPRRRAAIIALADRRALAAAVLLARDLRLLQGIWVYPQSELMTFFRGVATDLGEDTPIYVVGLAASPAREALQAAALYRGRITWFDHHDWPPEDLESLRRSIGEGEVFVTPGAPSPLAAVLRFCGRRSRFSDKLVELCAGRFSEHDYERWGRHWWHRLGEIAARSGDRRAELEPLLAGRPSELARAAGDLPRPPAPIEFEFVASRDFRLVHFGGHALVVVPTPAPFDCQLAARIARERYHAALSLAFEEGSETLLLAAEERGPRNLEVGALAAHVAGKHDWIELLPEEDRCAVLRVSDLTRRPERLDEVLREIAMGRSLLGG